MEIECPSGTKVELRKMKLRDEDILTNVTLAKKGENVDRLLESVTGMTREDLDKLLIGDRVFLLIQLRKISKGTEYSATLNCPECKSKFVHDIDLESLKVKKLDHDKVNENLEFEVVLPSSGHKLTARLLTGKEERTIRKIRREHPDKLLSYLMLIRTARIEGVKVKSIDWFREIEADDAEYFRKKYDEHDCGVDTTISCECPDCLASFEAEIPFDVAFFLRTTKSAKISSGM